MSRVAGNLLACGLGLVACGLVSCARPQVARSWQPSEFLIALRGAPPPKAELYAQVARAGFNAIADSVGSDALDLAQRHGLKAVLGQIGLDPQTLRDRANHAAVAEAIRRFSSHPALWGYFVGDEMLEGQLPAVAALADFARRHDPAHPLLVTLLPSDAWVGPALASGDYTGYVERFVRAVRPAVLCFAHFPFREKGTGEFYFENLELIRRVARDHGVPFYPTLQAAGWKGMRAPTEGELRWLVYTSLAYGAKGVVWFRYWGAPAGSRQGILEPDGQVTERYPIVAGLNAELRALGPVLMGLRSVAVHHTGSVPVGAARLPVHGLVAGVEGGSFVIGELEGEQDGKHLLVVNADHGREATAKVTLNRPCRSVEWFDPALGRWCEVATVTADRFQATVEFRLPPGGGRLVRVPSHR